MKNRSLSFRLHFCRSLKKHKTEHPCDNWEDTTPKKNENSEGVEGGGGGGRSSTQDMGRGGAMTENEGRKEAMVAVLAGDEGNNDDGDSYLRSKWETEKVSSPEADLASPEPASVRRYLSLSL